MIADIEDAAVLEAEPESLTAMFGRRAFDGLDVHVPEIEEKNLIADKDDLGPVAQDPLAGLAGDKPLTAENDQNLLNTTFERESFFSDILTQIPNLDLDMFADEIAFQSYAGHEGAYAVLRDMADLSGGKFPVQLESLAANVDWAQEARYSQTLSANTLADNRMAHRADYDVLEPEMQDMPGIGGPAVVTVTAVYEQLLNQGVEPNALDLAMGAGDGPEDYRAVLKAFHELANGDSSLQDYIVQADESLAFQEKESGVTEVKPTIAETQQSPALAVSPPENVYTYGVDGPRPGSPGMG